MVNTKFHEERLWCYAEYLRRGQLKCKAFITEKKNNSVANEIRKKEQFKNLFVIPILELPKVFEEDWYYDANYMPVYRNNKEKETIKSVIEYFGINKCIFLHLFSKGKQRTEIWGGNELSAKPTIPELVNNIEELIEHLRYYSQVKGNQFQIFLN